MTNGELRYPDANRLDLVERLPESAPAYDVADPYRWLEDATVGADRDLDPGAGRAVRRGERGLDRPRRTCAPGSPTCCRPA